MNPLINLLVRIAAGERPEKGSRRDTAWWLSGLALMPVAMALFTALATWLERCVDVSFLDSYAGIFSLIVLLVVFIYVVLAASVRTFQRFPLWLIPIAIATWSAGAWLVYHDPAR